MNQILTPPRSSLDRFMCSQPGNLQDLAAYSGHSSSYIVASDAEQDHTRQENTHPTSLPTDMGLRYMHPLTDDVRFSSESGTSHNPAYSLEPAVQHSSAIKFPSYPNAYHSGSLSGSHYGNSNPYSYSPSPSIFDIAGPPRLTSIHSPPGMGPPSRSPLPHPTSPLDIRTSYHGATPILRRTSDLLSGSPSSTLRGVPLSPSSSGGFASPTNMDNSQLGNGQLTPPLNPTETLHGLQTADGQMINPDIVAKIDKGFFMADTDWTCYRRNYFSLSCSYTLNPQIPSGTIHLVQNHGGPHLQVYGFAMSIAAVVDAQDGKSIELVQHTPKRDKGPQDKPPRIALAPRPHANHGMYGNDGGLGSSSRGTYDGTFGQSPNQPQTEATFERIQFKNATANNGKRRAAQQYYHLLVELFADVGQQSPDRYIKVAVRMSAPMVVRGRSPGHYQSERRGSNASAGPGGAGGAGGSGSYTPGGSSSRTSGELGMSGASSMLQGSSYGSSFDGRSHHYRSHNSSLQLPMEPTLSAEDSKNIDDPPCYMYYPGPIYEESRYQLPTLPEYASSNKIKQEYGGGGGYVLPSLTGNQDMGRHCGRWEGAPESRGYFPAMALQQELNIS